MRVQVQRVRDVELPAYQHAGDSGLDLVNAAGDVTLMPGERKLIPTGLKVAIPAGYEIQVRSRSGLALKKGLMVLNSPGTIDAGYRGEIGVILYNSSSSEVKVAGNDRVAQAVLQKVEQICWQETSDLPESRRQEGGFGSTGPC